MANIWDELEKQAFEPNKKEQPTAGGSVWDTLEARAFGNEPQKSVSSNRFSAAIDQYQAGFLGAGEAVTGALGFTGAEESLRERRIQNEQAAERSLSQAREQGAVESYRDVKDLSSAGSYVAGLAIQSAPYAAEALVGGLGARALMGGTRAALSAAVTGGDVIGEAAARQTLTRGSQVGAAAASYPSAVGDVLQNQRDQTGTTDLKSAAGLAIPYAALNVIGVEGALAKGSLFRSAGSLLDDVSGVKGGVTRAAVTGAKTGAAESFSETAQEGLNQLGRMAVDPNEKFLTPESIERFKESAVGGFVLGGAAGSLGGGWRRSEGSILPGSTDSGNLDVSNKPDNNAINKTIDSNSPEILVGPPPREALVGPQPPEQAGPPAPTPSQIQAAQQQIAAQKQQEAQDAFNQVASTYGIAPTGTGSFKLGGTLIRDQGIAQQYIQGFEAINQNKSPEQKAIFGAALSSGAAKIKPGASVKSIAQAANNFLNQWQFEGLNTKQEAADWANQQISVIEGSSAIKEAAPLNEFHKALTGQDSPAFATLVQQAEEKPTKQKKEGVTNGQLQLQQQGNAGLREVPVQVGPTQTGGAGIGNVRPISIQPVGTASLGEGSLGLQTGAIPSGGVSTSPTTTSNGATATNAIQGQGQTEVIEDDRVFAINEIEKMANAAFGTRDAKIIMEFIATDGAVNKAQIADKLGLSRARITQITGAPKEGETFNEQIERMAAEKWGPKLFIEGKRMGYTQADMLALFETTAKAQDEMAAETGETIDDQESEINAAPPTEEIYNTNADDVNIATSDEANYGTDLGSEELATSDEDGGQTASGYRIFNPKVSGTSELEDASSKNRAKFSKKDLSAMSDSQLQNLAADDETSAEKILQIAEELTKRQEKRVNKGAPSAVQKQSPSKGNVRKSAGSSKEVGETNAELEEPTRARQKGQTDEEAAAQAWNEGIKDFPDAPKFEELTAEQQEDWVSFGEENWTADDVQTELVKLAKESATGKAQFSRNEGAGKDQTWDVDGLTSLLKQLFVANRNFDNLISIVANYDELPTYVKNAVKKSGAIQAFVYGKRVYMLADQIEVGQELPVFLHEVGVHIGMENLLGTANYRKLAGQVMTWANAKNDSLESEIAKAAKTRVDAAVKAAKEAGETLTADEQLDEMLAYFVEEAVARGVNPTAIGKETSQVAQWFRSLVAALKIGLRKIGFGKFDQLSAGNIVDLAFGAAKLEISGAYHGTAAEFRDFRTAHIGTGEGAVAYGWGLYLAERFGIALDYMRSDVKRKQMHKRGEPDITYKGLGAKDLTGLNTDLFKADRLEYDRRQIAATMIRDLHYDYNNTLTVQSLIDKKIAYYEKELKATNELLENKSSFLGTIFAPNEKAIKEAQINKEYYERSIAAVKSMDSNDFDFPSKVGFTYKGRTKKDLRRAEMQNLGKDLENKVALDVVRAYEKATEAFGVPVPIEDVIKFEIEQQQKRIDNNEIGALSGTIQKTIDALKALNPKDFVDSDKKPGNLMRVLPMAEEGALMDLDTRLARQPEILQKIKDGFPQEVLEAIDEKSNLELEDMTGRDLQRVLVDLENQGITDLFFQMPDSITDNIKQGRFMSEAIVSKYLEYKLGIEGVKYFDASSRNIGNQVSVAKLPEVQKINFEVRGKKFIPKYASIRSNDVILKGRVGDLSHVQVRLSEYLSNEEVMAVIDHIKDEQARQTKNVVMFADKGVSRIATFPGAQLGGKVQYSLKQAREQASKQINKLPPNVAKPTNYVVDTIEHFAKKSLPYFAFTEDLANMAAKFIPSVKKYVNLMKERQATRTRLERQVDDILQDYDKLPSEVKGTGENSVNKFLMDSTRDGKWAYNPGWIKDFKEETDIDADMKARFDKLPAAAQKLVERIFTHGQSTLQLMQKSVIENINSEYDALIAAAKKAGNVQEEQDLIKKKASSLSDYRTLMRLNSKKPYAPLKRFGDYVVVGKSQQYLDNEKIVNDKTSTPDVKAEAAKKLRELEKNDMHYFVQFAETVGEAKAVARQEAGNYAQVEDFEKDTSNTYGGRDINSTFHRLRNLVEENKDSNLGDASERAVNRLLADLHLTLLSEQSARQSERRRRGIGGAEKDMMRAFATQGRATASFISSLENTGNIYDILREMKEETDKGTVGTRGERRQYYNEFMKRHFMGMDYRPSPFMDKALSTTSMWMLLTNPAYYLQNMTQPFMMSLPVIGARYGYARSWKEMTRAYTDIASVIKKHGLSEESYNKLPEDVRNVVEVLVNRGRIDISLEQDLGRWRSTEDAKLAKFGRASELLRGMAQDIETINRVATAVAAYRLALKGPKGNPTMATNYADNIIYTTHGDYSGFNAPRITRQGLGRLATQFRKFQLIQISLIARLYNDAFHSEDADTRLVGKKALAYTVGHTAVMGGIMGLPGFAAIAALYGMLFGDEDEPDNPELALRRAIGNDTLADLLLKGVPAALGVDVSGKIGMGQMLSILPYTDVKFTRKDLPAAGYALLTGPFGGLTLKAADGVSYMGAGNYQKGLEQLLPSGLGNILKAQRYATEGITTKAGDVVMKPEDIGAIDAFMVALGLPTKPITDRNFLNAAKFQYDEFYNEKASDIKREYVRAYKEGDNAGLSEAREDWKNLQESRAKNGYTKQPLSTLLKAPQEQKKRERNVTGGVQFNKANRGFVQKTSEL